MVTNNVELGRPGECKEFGFFVILVASYVFVGDPKIELFNRFEDGHFEIEDQTWKQDRPLAEHNVGRWRKTSSNIGGSCCLCI